MLHGISDAFDIISCLMPTLHLLNEAMNIKKNPDHCEHQIALYLIFVILQLDKILISETS